MVNDDGQSDPLKALVIGVGLPLVGVKLWIFTLGALGTIAEAQLGQPGSTMAYLLFILLAQALLLIPILIRILMPATVTVHARWVFRLVGEE